MHRNRSVDTHQFAMVPRAEIPRASFNIQRAHKTTFDAGYLVPVLVEEILPGDTFNVKMTAFARLATPIFPVMDNLYMDSFFFFVPNRLVWTNWVKFMGEQANPGDSISYAIPVCNPTTGYAVGSLQDYCGLITTPQNNGNPWSHNALPLRCYNLIYNEWFRDENLISSAPRNVGDGPTARPTTFSVVAASVTTTSPRPCPGLRRAARPLPCLWVPARPSCRAAPLSSCVLSALLAQARS